MNEQYDGKDVFEANGDLIGQIERSFLDDNGVVRMIEVRTSGLHSGSRLVPVDGATFEEQGLRIPYTMSQVTDSPQADTGADALEGDSLARIQNYYDRVSASRSSAEASASASSDEGIDPTAIRDVGDYIEIPLVEEVLVKKQVVREVIRVRKTELVSTEQVEGTVRAEDIKVETTGGLESPEVRESKDCYKGQDRPE